LPVFRKKSSPMNLSLPIRMAHELHFYGLQLIISKGLNMKRQFVLFALLLMVLLPVGARAQEVASLTGVVTDPQRSRIARRHRKTAGLQDRHSL